MTKATGADAEVEDLRAIVHPATALQHFTLERHEPGAELGRFVDRFWRTGWELAEPFEQTVVTYPAVNLVLQADGSFVVSGIRRTADRRRLEGRGWALAAMFRPGGFRPLAGRSMAELTDRRVDGRDLFGADADRLVREVLAAQDDEARRDLLAAFLIERLPEDPTDGEVLSGLVESAVAGEWPVTRVAELARRHGSSVRTLQRLFAEHIGLGPKSVLDRYRVLAAAEALRIDPGPLGELAARLGYADQAHLTADLRAQFGSPPAAYARAERGSG